VKAPHGSSGPIRHSGPWSPEEINAYLDATVIPIRLSCIDRSGWPRVFSLWYLRQGCELCCSTQAGSVIATAMKANPRCAFEIAGDHPPYRGVRGRGLARVEPDPPEDILRRLIRRYLHDDESSLARWLLGRRSSEVTIRVTPSHLYSWDYTRRMTDR
jgi:nitroimidazol reductase NimA-like FMN-containing flavoprotein (pyridoxamine 5'-phosphate oxidase superfamily)